MKYDKDFYINFTGFMDPDVDRSHLKDVRGAYRTNLFYEINYLNRDKYPPIYTMREDEWEGLPSAYRIYMYSASEWEAAMKLVGSWAHWQRLLQVPQFVNGSKESHTWNGIAAWREEKELMDRMVAYDQLKQAAAGGNVQAQKAIYDGEKAKRGRPSKAEIRKAAQEEAAKKEKLKEDFARIGLKAVDGTKQRAHN
jgi:hypothetical protein